MTITVKIPKQQPSKIKFEVDGIEGKDCLTKTLNLRRALTAASPMQRKDAFYAEAAAEAYQTCQS
jgi:hypothetical protein